MRRRTGRGSSETTGSGSDTGGSTTTGDSGTTAAPTTSAASDPTDSATTAGMSTAGSTTSASSTTSEGTTDSTSTTITTTGGDSVGPSCMPGPNANLCQECVANGCCDEITACGEDEGCSCIFECSQVEPNTQQCWGICGLAPGENEAINDLFDDMLVNCSNPC